MPRLDDVVRHFAFAWEAAGPVCSAPPEDQRLYVKSEAYSAIRSLGKFLKRGNNFLIADIGATTTDLSVIRVGFDQLACYAAYSVSVGVDRVDSRYLAKAGTGVHDVLSIRLERHREPGGTILQREAYRIALESTAEELKDGLRKVVHAAIEKNRDRQSWERIHVIVAGGGSNIAQLRGVFTAGPPPHNFIRDQHTLTPEIPKAVVVGQSAQPPRPNEAFELLSVLGTATPVYEDMEYKGPNEFETVIPIFESPTRELDKIRYMTWV